MANEKPTQSEVSNVEVTTSENGETSAHTQVSRREFIREWERVCASENPSTQAVADALGLKKDSVTQRASAYRSQGVDLTRMPRGGGAKFDKAAAQAELAEIRAELAASNSESEDSESESETADA